MPTIEWIKTRGKGGKLKCQNLKFWLKKEYLISFENGSLDHVSSIEELNAPSPKKLNQLTREKSILHTWRRRMECGVRTVKWVEKFVNPLQIRLW